MNFVRTLTLRQLQIFVVAARHLSYARAAEELHLTPPAVSMQLKQLEDNVGLPLFERMGRGVALTGAVNLVGYFPTPTPGKPNREQGPGFAPPVDFSEPSRTYSGALNLTLSTTNAAAIIRYTTNGTLPTVDSPAYAAPVTITSAVQVRARAFVSGLLPGPLHSETYVPLGAPAAAFTSDLPVLLIHHFDR